MSSDFEQDDDLTQEQDPEELHQTLESDAEDAAAEAAAASAAPQDDEDSVDLGDTFSEAKGIASGRIFDRSVWSKPPAGLHDSVRPKTPEAHGSAYELEELESPAAMEHPVGFESSDGFETQVIESPDVEEDRRVTPPPAKGVDLNEVGFRRGEIIEVLEDEEELEPGLPPDAVGIGQEESSEVIAMGAGSVGDDLSEPMRERTDAIEQAPAPEGSDAGADTVGGMSSFVRHTMRAEDPPRDTGFAPELDADEEREADEAFAIPAEFEDAPTPGDGSSFMPRASRVTLDADDGEDEDVPLKIFGGSSGDGLTKPSHYINRELSWLEFNQRVLWQAKEAETPLLERVKFLCISSTNLDEFFEIRVGRLKQQLRMNAPRIGPDGMTPHEQLDHIYAFTQAFVKEQYRVLNEELIPELAEQGIRFLRRSTWNTAQAEWVSGYFDSEVLPVLSPLGLDPAHPFPRVLNKSLNFIVSLEGQDAFGRSSGLAVVQAPRALPRLIQIPEEVSGGAHDFVFLSSIIHAHVGELFPGMRPKGCYQFRATRNSELFVDEEEVEDLMHAMEEELYQRHYGDAVRLEVADNCPMEAAHYLLKQFGLTERELFQVRGPVNLGRLMMIPGAIDRPDLKDEPFVQRTVHLEWPRKQDIFAQLRQNDILLHHPFESFATVIEFFKQASEDPNVLAIKQTVYRTEEDSVLVDALVNAARAGKEVTAVIELRARFDEERNIHIANRLQEAGAHVVYGVVGYKTHAKMALVVRREGGSLKRYVHLGTGNYHPRTARLYTDFGLMTYNQELGEDVHNMFQQLTGLGRVMEMHHILHSPFTLHSAILDKIEREMRLAAAGERGHIMAKINSLTEPEVVRALYRASRAGVRIDLIVRGICRLRPGHDGLSETIHVRSIVGRFLEHTRCFYFRNGGEEEVWCASADWMSRNLLRRVETCFPILDPELRARVIHEQFQVYLRDNTKAWELNEDGSYTKLTPPAGALAFSAQDALLDELAAES